MALHRRALFFFPHNPYPPTSGAHQRCLELVAALNALCYELMLFSSTVFSDTEWTMSSIQGLRESCVSGVWVHTPSVVDYPFVILRKLYGLLGAIPGVNSALYAPPLMRKQFTRMLHAMSPDMVLISYPFWDCLLDHERFKSVCRVIDTYGLSTLSVRRWEILKRYLPRPPIRAHAVDDTVLEEDFFERLGLITDPEEFRIYDRYDYTLALSTEEADIIKRNAQHTEVVVVPTTQEPRPIANQYVGPALFPTGPNPFNLQGYLYFVKKVLPRVRQRAPSFSLQVTGACCGRVSHVEGVVVAGFVRDLQSVYERSRFVVCPVFGTTGPQVKIVEAMAYGVPVIALRAAAAGSPIRHGVNGYIATSADEFAEYVIELWNHQALCRQMGQAARDTIAAEFSRSRLIHRLSSVFHAR